MSIANALTGLSQGFQQGLQTGSVLFADLKAKRAQQKKLYNTITLLDRMGSTSGDADTEKLFASMSSAYKEQLKESGIEYVDPYTQAEVYKNAISPAKPPGSPSSSSSLPPTNETTSSSFPQVTTPKPGLGSKQ